MGTVWLEVVIILFLILVNGFFAGAELAIVSVRRGRIAQLAAEGSEKAKVVEQLHANPYRFLATVQVGVTLVGTLASAVGGAAAVEVIRPILQQLPSPAVSNYAEPLAIFLVVGTIAYLSLVLGELVPKALALEYPEPIALVVAKPIRFLARIGGMAVFILTVSSRAVLVLLGVRDKRERAFVTKEEIQHLIAEARETGTVTVGEQEFIRNVFEFSQTEVREVMVPRTRIVGLNLESTREKILKTVLESRFSRFPVYRGDIQHLEGFVHGKDLLGRAVQNPDFDLESLLRPAFFVPESKKVNDLLREMQRRHLHMAMVVDEHGSLGGLATTEDLLEELVGEIEDEKDIGAARRIQRLDKGKYLVDAFLPLKDLEDLLGVSFSEGLPYDSLSGLILSELGHIPVEGERVRWGGFLLTCVKVTQTTIRKVKIEPAEPQNHQNG
jgi:putative hemolysin